jgi:hypothetical protein
MLPLGESTVDRLDSVPASDLEDVKMHTRCRSRRGLPVTLSMLALGAAALLSLTDAPPALAYPEPAIVTRAWQFDFTYQKPAALAVRDVEGDYRWYWYLPYKVVNNTGQEEQFVPEITIATDAGDLLTAGSGVPASVFDAVKAKLGNDLLESPIAILGRLLQGEDYAKESVAIWPAPSHDVDQIRIFVSGLSGETTRIPNPLTGESVLLRKTLMIEFTLPGNPATPQDQPVIPSSEAWIMR